MSHSLNPPLAPPAKLLDVRGVAELLDAARLPAL